MQDGSNPEEEYFHKRQQEQLAKLREAQSIDAARSAAAELKELHYFRCGKCGHEMKTQVFKGIEVEICTNCGSVLLDPGELQQLAGDDEGFVLRMKDFFTFSRN